MTVFPFKKALVTGGAGFIGSHIAERLSRMGVETISLDNYVAGKHENIEHLKRFKNFSEFECDITDLYSLEKYFQNVDVVFHQAASKKTICLRDPRLDLKINAEGTFNLLELSKKYGVKKFVHASTGSVYGEAQYFPQNEEHPLNPVSYYGVSKLAGERYVKVFEKLYDLNVSILRYFHVYGARQESSDVGGVVSIFARHILQDEPITIFGDGSQQRSFTHVDNVVDANILSAIIPGSKGKVYNCASGLAITINELAMMIYKILGKRSNIVYKDWLVGDIKKFDIDNRKIKKDLGLEFMTNFEHGLKTTLEWSKKYFGNKD